MNVVAKKAVWSVKPMVIALALAGASSLPLGAWAQAVPFEVEGTVTSITPGPDGSANLVMFGQTYNVPNTAYIHTPTKTLTIDELLDMTPLPGRTLGGFLNGTGILIGTVASPGPGAVAVINDVAIEPAETVLLGAVTGTEGGIVKIMGVPLVELPRDPAFRMPSHGFTNEFGFEVDPATVPVGVLGAAEGYFGDDQQFHHFHVEVGGGTLVDPTTPAVSILRARCGSGARLEVLGGSYLPAAATIQVFNANTGYSFGSVATVIDPLTPQFGAYRFRADVGTGLTDTDGNCPSVVRVVNVQNGKEAISLVAGVTAPPPPPPDNLPPVAENDVAGTTAGLAVNVNLVENDTDPNNNLDPTTVQIVDNAGLSILFPDPRDGSITVTPTTAGTFNITYTVSDTGDPSLTSNVGTLQLVVQPAPVIDIVTVTRANYRQSRDRWDVRGTTNVPGATITLSLVSSGQEIATAVADAAGFWLFDVRGAGIFPVPGDSIRVTSSSGGTIDSQIVIVP